MSLGNADGGDIRSNYLNLDESGYVSNFDLVDGIAVIQYQGPNERYPVRLSGNFVKNLGAASDEEVGFSLDFFVGRASQKDDLRFRYGYSEAETDAVLAPFSNDNTTIATNYEQHTLPSTMFPRCGRPST